MNNSNQQILQFANIESILCDLYTTAEKNNQLRYYTTRYGPIHTRYALVSSKELMKKVGKPKLVMDYISRCGWSTGVRSRERDWMSFIIVFEDLIPEKFWDLASVYPLFCLLPYEEDRNASKPRENASRIEYQEAKAMGKKKLEELKDWMRSEIESAEKPCLVTFFENKLERWKTYEEKEGIS